jgi:hypothetical protein
MTKESGFAVAVGDPFSGMSLYGPFDTSAEAIEYADSKFFGENWWVMALLEPKP